MKTVVILLFGITAIIVLGVIVSLNRKYNGVLVLSGSLFAFLGYYCIVPIIALLASDRNNKLEGYLETLSKASGDDYLRMFFCFFLFLTALFMSYSYFSKMNNNRVVVTGKFKKSIKFWAWFTFIVGGLSFIIYAYSFGGFVRLIAYAELMRSFATDKADLFTGRTYILVVPSRLITVAAILFLLYLKYVKKDFLSKVCLIVSLVLSVLFYLSNAGKTGVLTFGLCFLIPLLSYRFRHEWILTICVSVLGIGIIGYLDALFLYFDTNEFVVEQGGGILSSIAQFSYPISNVLSLDGITGLSGFRYGQDFLTGILNIIPGVNFSTSTEVTSMYYGGADWHTTGGTPNDMITYGFLELGYFGVVFVGLLLGCISAIVDRCLMSLNDSFAERILKCSLVLLFFLVMVNADTISIVREQFLLTILSYSVISSSKIMRLSRYDYRCLIV